MRKEATDDSDEDTGDDDIEAEPEEDFEEQPMNDEIEEEEEEENEDYEEQKEEIEKPKPGPFGFNVQEAAKLFQQNNSFPVPTPTNPVNPSVSNDINAAPPTTSFLGLLGEIVEDEDESGMTDYDEVKVFRFKVISSDSGVAYFHQYHTITPKDDEFNPKQDRLPEEDENEDEDEESPYRVSCSSFIT